MADIKFNGVAIGTSKNVTFVFANQANTSGTNGNQFIAPNGFTATEGDGVVYVTSNATFIGNKNFNLINFGYPTNSSGNVIAFPKQTVTQLTDTDRFLSYSSDYTLSVNSSNLLSFY
jgi:hypothetical protein